MYDTPKGLDLYSSINLIVKYILNDEGVLELQFQDAKIAQQSSLQLRLNTLHLIGLDMFTQFNIFAAVGPHCCRIACEWRNL